MNINSPLIYRISADLFVDGTDVNILDLLLEVFLH
jgi:hypothetical protein